MEDDDDILGLNDALAYKKSQEEVNSTPRQIRPDPTFTAQAVLDARLKEVQMTNAMSGAAERAYFDDDSISTLGSTINTPQSTKKTNSSTSTPTTMTGQALSPYSEYRNNIGTQLFDSDYNNPRYPDSDHSITSTVTMESVQFMIDKRMGGIESMMKQILNTVQVDKNNQSLSTTVTTHNTGTPDEATGNRL